MKEFKIRASQASKLLGNGKQPYGLTETATSYLKEWYSEQMFGEIEEIQSKFLDKGKICESEAIDIVAERLGLGVLKKNTKTFEDSWFTGTPDILTPLIDTKCSWDGKTFLNAVSSKPNDAYLTQIKTYLYLTGQDKGYLCYCLVDTPKEVNYGNFVSYSHISIEKRFFKILVEADPILIETLKEKVNSSRLWLTDYDEEIKAKLKIKD